jgi:uncharacterized membrane protein YbhN (UPF0104 family)
VVLGRRGKRVLKAAVGLVVLAAVARQVALTATSLAHHDPPLSIAPLWLLAAVPIYLIGLAFCGAFYALVLHGSATPVPFRAAVRAYLVSHLGKYVPGKAMVVVVRTGLVVPHGARPATAALATLYETLVMMASGGLVAAVGLSLPPTRWIELPSGPWGSGLRVPLWLPGLAAAVLFGVLVEARMFARLGMVASLPFPGVGRDALPRLNGRRLLEGLALTSVGWAFMGLSQVAVLRALMPEGVPVSLWPAAVGGVALATVAGFAVAVAPGGLGVREWVLWTALGAALGDRDRAVVAALALRLVWVVAEMAAAGLLLMLFRPPAAVIMGASESSTP